MATRGFSQATWVAFLEQLAADTGKTLLRGGQGPAPTFPTSLSSPNWFYVDFQVDVCLAAGFDLLTAIWTSPGWMHPACAGYQCPPDPAHYQDWADAAVMIFDRSSSRGLSPTVFEYWNEPWIGGFWRPAPNPAAYMALGRTVCSTVWDHYPGMTIIFSADHFQGSGATWFPQVLAADTTGLLTDPRIAFSVHNYVECAAPAAPRSFGYAFDRYEIARADALAHGHPDPQIWCTEFGWEANTGTVSFCGVSEANQATYTGDGIDMMEAAGYVPVSCVFEATLSDAWGYNIYRTNGSARPVVATLATKP